MTDIEKRIYYDIANGKDKVKIFWDMDGTCASMEMHQLPHKLEQGFFLTKRPIHTIIKIMKKFHNLGAQTFILSFCSYEYQRKDKIIWLQQHCNFIDTDNIIIIPRKESAVKYSESKQTLKAEYLKDYISNDDIVYMIDDNESVLIGTKQVLQFINIASPIDFIA